MGNGEWVGCVRPANEGGVRGRGLRRWSVAFENHPLLLVVSVCLKYTPGGGIL